MTGGFGAALAEASTFTRTPGVIAMCSTAPWPANQVSVHPPQSQMRVGAVATTQGTSALYVAAARRVWRGTRLRGGECHSSWRRGLSPANLSMRSLN
jgi:hypothetical protein